MSSYDMENSRISKSQCDADVTILDSLQISKKSVTLTSRWIHEMMFTESQNVANL